MLLIIAATFAAAFVGALVGVYAGLMIGTHAMVSAVKKAFGPWTP